MRVRIAGNAVNPIPYIEGTNFELALAGKPQDPLDEDIAMGGPEARKSSDNSDDDAAPARVTKKRSPAPLPSTRSSTRQRAAATA